MTKIWTGPGQVAKLRKFSFQLMEEVCFLKCSYDLCAVLICQRYLPLFKYQKCI